LLNELYQKKKAGKREGRKKELHAEVSSGAFERNEHLRRLQVEEKTLGSAYEGIIKKSKQGRKVGKGLTFNSGAGQPWHKGGVKRMSNRDESERKA